MQGIKENKMGTMPEGKLLAQVSLPIVISMLVQALYNVVDGIFVGRISGGSEELTAVGLALPIQLLMIAVAVGTAVGVNSMLSRRLGEKNQESANRTAANGIFLGLLSWLVFLVFGLFFTHFYFNLVLPLPTDAAAIAAMGEEYISQLAVREMGIEYTRITSIFSIGVFMSIIVERILQATGRSMYLMVSQLAGALVNIVLDPILIFGLLGFPQMGVKGAAVATVIGQGINMLLCFYFNHFKNPDIHIRWREFRPSGKTIKHIYQVGLPSIIMQAVGSIMTMAMNVILIKFSTAAVEVFGMYARLQSFVFMPIFGLNSGMISIVAYNYGARKPERIRKTVKLTVIICFAIMVTGTLLFWAFPDLLLNIFAANEESLLLGRSALRIISICFPMAGISIVFSGVFQSLGNGIYSLIMSIVRQLVFLLPLAWLLARISGLPAVWYSFTIAEVFSLALAIFYFIRLWRNKISPLTEPVAAGGHSL